MKKILAFLFVVFQQENLYLENKIKSLENNARYFESQAHPLFVENFNLKDQIISLTESIKSILKIITNNFMDLEILYLLISFAGCILGYKVMTKLIATLVKGRDSAG